MSIFNTGIKRNQGNGVKEEDNLKAQINNAFDYFFGKSYSMVYYKNSHHLYSKMIYCEVLYRQLVNIANDPGFEGFVLTDVKGIEKLINENKQQNND